MYPGEIAAGPDDALWFGGPDEIGRITTGGEIEGFPLPLGVGLFGVTPGPDGNVWFTEAERRADRADHDAAERDNHRGG